MFCFMCTPKFNTMTIVTEESAAGSAEAWPSYIFFYAELAPVEEEL